MLTNRKAKQVVNNFKKPVKMQYGGRCSGYDDIPQRSGYDDFEVEIREQTCKAASIGTCINSIIWQKNI